MEEDSLIWGETILLILDKSYKNSPSLVENKIFLFSNSIAFTNLVSLKPFDINSFSFNKKFLSNTRTPLLSVKQ